ASGRESEAVSIFEKTINLVPYDPEAYRSLARNYVLLKKKVEACEVLGKAVQLFPLDPGIRTLSRDCESSETAELRAVKEQRCCAARKEPWFELSPNQVVFLGRGARR